jgi:hypothetical protein
MSSQLSNGILDTQQLSPSELKKPVPAPTHTGRNCKLFIKQFFFRVGGDVLLQLFQLIYEVLIFWHPFLNKPNDAAFVDKVSNPSPSEKNFRRPE